MKLHRLLALGLLIFSYFGHYKISGTQVPPGLECFSAEELQKLEQELKAAGQDIEAYINSHPEEFAKFCDDMIRAETEAKKESESKAIGWRSWFSRTRDAWRNWWYGK